MCSRAPLRGVCSHSRQATETGSSLTDSRHAASAPAMETRSWVRQSETTNSLPGGRAHAAGQMLVGEGPRSASCVPVALHLAPHAAHRALADLSTKYAAKFTPHAARIGAGKTRTGDQRVGLGCGADNPLHIALPFRRFAAGTVQSGAWHRDLSLPESARQRANPASMPMAVTTAVKSLPSEPARQP
jgi:hypothetical protein